MTKVYYFCSDEQYQPEDLVDYAIAAEAAGFDGIMISEHFHPWVDDHGTSGFSFSTLGAMAVKTKKINLMTAVTSPLFRFHPGVVAQAAATIDRLSGGRFELGIGSGESINEAPLGFKFPGYKERSERLKEAVEIISRLLSGEKVDFRGKYYQTKSAKLYSPPLHQVPILLAAGGPQSARTAGRICDGIITSVRNLKDANEIIKYARQTSTDPGFKVVATHWSTHSQNSEEALEALKSQRGLRAPSRSMATDPIQLQIEADELPKEDILSQYSHLKNAKDFIDTYSPLILDLKADILGIQTTSLNQLSTISMLGSEVLPKLRKL